MKEKVVSDFFFPKVSAFHEKLLFVHQFYDQIFNTIKHDTTSIQGKNTYCKSSFFSCGEENMLPFATMAFKITQKNILQAIYECCVDRYFTSIKYSTVPNKSLCCITGWSLMFSMARSILFRCPSAAKRIKVHLKNSLVNKILGYREQISILESFVARTTRLQ